MKYFLLFVFIIMAVVNFYKQREILKQFTKREWKQYIGSFAGSTLVMFMVIFSSSYITKLVANESLHQMINVGCILLGFIIGSYILGKFLPLRLKQGHLSK